MQSKWMILAATMVSVSVLATGLSMADDKEGPVHDLMEKVSSTSNAIKKACRTDPAFKKAQQGKVIVKHTEELLKLAKETGELAKKGAEKAKALKDPEKKWKDYSDAFAAELEKFKAVVSKPNAKQEDAKTAWGIVNQSCTNCHNDFRVDDDDKF